MQTGDPSQATRHGVHVPASHTDDKRLAELIGNGEIPFPNDMAATKRSKLAALVRERRRLQLVHFLAQQVAQHLADRASWNKEERKAECYEHSSTQSDDGGL